MTTITTRGRKNKRPVNTLKPRLERLEDRLALSGFGPEDGAYIIAPNEGQYLNVAIQPRDQKIVTSGYAWDSHVGNTISGSGTAVARYDATGNADDAYGNGGLAKIPTFIGQAVGLALQSDGKAIVSGLANSKSFGTVQVGRLNSDGTPDSTFGSSGKAVVSIPSSNVDNARAVALQSTGKIILAGNTSYGTTTSSFDAMTARVTATGAVDSGKGGYGDLSSSKPSQPIGYTESKLAVNNSSGPQFNNVAVQSDDKVVAVGQAYVGAHAQLEIARYTKDGVLDTTFNKSGYASILPSGAITDVWATGVALQADGKIVVSGTSISANAAADGYANMFVARYNTNGKLDTTFGGGAGYVRLHVGGTNSGSSESANGVAIQADGKIVVMGAQRFTDTGPHSAVIARLNTNGTLDQNFGAGGFKLGTLPSDAGILDLKANGVALESDGSIIVAGFVDFETTSGGDHPLLMRFSGANNAPAAQQTASATDAALLLLLMSDPTTTSTTKK